MAMETMPIGIATVIQEAATESGLSLAELASATKLSYDSVLRKVRRQTRSISVDELQAFAEALEIPASTLVKRAEERTGTPRARGESCAALLEGRHVAHDGGESS